MITIIVMMMMMIMMLMIIMITIITIISALRNITFPDLTPLGSVDSIVPCLARFSLYPIVSTLPLLSFLSCIPSLPWITWFTSLSWGTLRTFGTFRSLFSLDPLFSFGPLFTSYSRLSLKLNLESEILYREHKVNFKRILWDENVRSNLLSCDAIITFLTLGELNVMIC